MKRPLALLLVAGASAAEPVPYGWPAGTRDGDLEARFPPPAGTARVPASERSFGAWLRHLPLQPRGAAVHLFDGTVKPRQDVHAAVVDLDVPRRDLQQCADAVMRLRAEYLWATGRVDAIRFHPDPGKPRVIAWSGGRARGPAWDKFLVRLFADAGSASLQAEMRPVGARAIEPGDVLIQGGYPGHAVIVLDVAEGGGRRLLLLGQSYMPAQQLHVLVNPGDAALSPWYDAAALDGGGVATPEWRPFRRRDARRFAD